MAPDPETPTRTGPTRSWPSLSVWSARLCRPHLRLVDPWPEIRLETSAVLSLAAISVGDGEIAVDGVLVAGAAGTTLDVNGIPVLVRSSGGFSTAFELGDRRTLTVTLTLPLVTTVEPAGGPSVAGAQA